MRCRLLFLTLFFLLLSVALAAGEKSPAAAQSECRADPALRRARYELEAAFDWRARLVQVQQVVTYRNDGTMPLTELVFHSEPHRQSRLNVMTFYNAYNADGAPLPGVTFDKMRMTVPLGTAVPSGCEAVVRLQYDIKIHALSDENVLGWLAFTESQINIAHWFPVVALYEFETPGAWYTPPRHFIGEQAVTEFADIRVKFQVVNAPDNVVLVAPGTITATGPQAWEMHLAGGREFGMSFSTIYTVQAQQVGAVTVELYTLATTNRGSAARAMQDATQAVALFTELYGPLPYDRLVVAEGDFEDGLELSGMVFVSRDWFVGWNGDPVHWLSVITVHEVAHQWFYALLMNDQGNAPYLDEALATYSELLYFESQSVADTWWQFRIAPYRGSTDPVDATVYEYTNWRPYINAVYFRGAMMLDEMRARLGDDLFFRWIKQYVADNREGVVRPQDFWGALSRFGYDSTADVRLAYLRTPEPLGG